MSEDNAAQVPLLEHHRAECVIVEEDADESGSWGKEFSRCLPPLLMSCIALDLLSNLTMTHI